jgi:hypothetical protein
MVMVISVMSVMMALTVGAAFRLESALYRLKMCSEAAEHIFDHVVRPNPKSMLSDLGWQMPITQVPAKAHQL